MKKHLITQLLLFIPLVIFSQTNSYTSLRNYPIVGSLDSLQKMVERQKDNPTQHLHALVNLERHRILLNNDVSIPALDTIQAMAQQQQSILAMAANDLNYANAYLIKGNNLLVMKHFLKAKDEFEKINDANGILAAYGGLIQMNYEKDIVRGDKTNAKYYFDKLMQLSKNSNHEIDKLYGLRYIIECNPLLDKKPTQKEVEATFQKIMDFLDKHPELEILRKNYYIRVQRGYNVLRAFDKQLEYAIKSLKISGKNAKHWDYFHVGNAYKLTNQYDSSLVYNKKAIDEYKSQKVFGIEQLKIYYDNYIDVFSKMGRYKEALQANFVKDSIADIILEKNQKKAIIELQTKYETEKKDVTIKKLELEKQLSDIRTKQLIWGLLLAAIIIGTISYLLFRLKKTNDEVLLLQKNRNKLFTIISHDLRSPLNTYQQYSDIVKYLLRTKQFDRLDETLKQIDETGLHLASLLNNLLEWSVSQQRQLHLKPIPINLKKLIDEILPIYRDMATLKSIKFMQHLHDQNFSSDPNILSFIVRNLLDNAIKYTPNGQRIFFHSSTEGNQLILTINNVGDIMTEQQKTKITNLFEGKHTYEIGEDGLGVGLILIKQYATTINANIVFEHNNTGNTTFIVKLPLNIAQ